LDVQNVVATFTYLGRRCGGLDHRLAAAHANEDASASIEHRLIRKLLVLLQNPPATGNPLWWHMWKTLAEDPWLRSQQVSVARRLVRHQDLVEEMCQVSTIHLGTLLQRSPTLGLSVDEFPLRFARWTRRTIRSGLITWLRLLSGERRRTAALSATGWGNVHNLQPIDKLEIAAAMRDLPALHRDIVEMRSVGYKRSEIARVLNLSIFQVDRIFASCRNRLRQRLRALREQGPWGRWASPPEKPGNPTTNSR
jgi:DNA-directed RNA polymerase specialized sigma24 family protein